MTLDQKNPTKTMAIPAQTILANHTPKMRKTSIGDYETFSWIQIARLEFDQKNGILKYISLSPCANGPKCIETP